jgi:hypothetical protein
MADDVSGRNWLVVQLVVVKMAIFVAVILLGAANDRRWRQQQQ